MPWTVYATNQPDVALEVSDEEFIDLQRQGLLVPGRGDVNSAGKLKRNVAADASPEVLAAQPAPTYTSPIPTVPSA